MAETIQQLYQQYGHLNGISIECQKELIAIGIKNKAATAEVFLQGAQLSRYRRLKETPLIYLSNECDYKVGVSLRGGIPICWPWFGSLDKNPAAVQSQFDEEAIKNAPAHGFVRSLDWTVDAIETPTDAETLIKLSHHNTSDNPYWPFDTHLHYQLTIGESLSAQLTIENTDSRAMVFTDALHTYLSVSHIDRVSIGGFDDCPYIDTVNHWQSTLQQDDIRFTQEVDRLYSRSAQPIELYDKTKTTTLHSQGSNSTVVWNPWIEKAMRLSQFNNEDYTRMVCIETANVMDDYITLEAGAKHHLQLTIQSSVR